MANRDWAYRGADGLSFGERLGDLISSKGINQTQLAAATGVNQPAISEYINGKKQWTELRVPDCATIIALARYFSVSTDYLLGITDIKSPNQDIVTAVKITGLKQESVELLSLFNQFESRGIANVLDILIDDSRFYNFDGNRCRRSIVTLLNFFFKYSNANNRKQVFDDGRIVDSNDADGFISSNAIDLDDTIIENAVLAEIQHALIDLKKAQLDTK